MRALFGRPKGTRLKGPEWTGTIQRKRNGVGIAPSNLQQWEDRMYAVVRSYSGSGARDLFGILEDRKAEVEDLIRGVSGFRAYTILRTDEGGISVTICDNKTGTDESNQLARDWIAKNAAEMAVDPPDVSEGPVILQLS